MSANNNSENPEHNNVAGVINIGGNDDGSIIEDDNVIEDECITPQDEEEHVRSSRRKKRGEQANGVNKNSRNGRNNTNNNNANNIANRGNQSGNNIGNTFTDSRSASREHRRNDSINSVQNNATNRINSVSASASVSASVSVNGNGNTSNPLRSSTMNESWNEPRSGHNYNTNHNTSTINNQNNANISGVILNAVPGDGYYDDIYDDLDRNEITNRQNGFFNHNGSNTDSSNTSQRNLVNANNSINTNEPSVAEERTQGENKREGETNSQRDPNGNNSNNINLNNNQNNHNHQNTTNNSNHRNPNHNNGHNNNPSNNVQDQEGDESLEVQSRIANPSYSEADEVEVEDHLEEELVEEAVIIRRENENGILNQRSGGANVSNGTTNLRDRNDALNRLHNEAFDFLEALPGVNNSMQSSRNRQGRNSVGMDLSIGFVVPSSRSSSVSSHTNDNNHSSNTPSNNNINMEDGVNNNAESNDKGGVNGMADNRSVSDSLMLVTRDRVNSHSNTLQNGNLDNLTVCLQKELTCPICLDYFHLPVTMNCGHTFCRYCIGHNKLNGKSCPLCRQPLGNTLCINTIISNLVRICNLRRKSYTLYKSIELINTVDEHWWCENFIKPQVSVSLFLRIFLNDMVSPAIFFDDLTTCIIDYFTVNNLWSKAKWVFNIRDCRVFSELIGYNKDDKEMTNERLHAWVENYITKNPSMCMRKDEKLILKLYQDRTHRIDSHIFDSAYLPNRLPWDGGRHAKSLIHMPHSSVSLSHLLFVKLENNTIGVVDCGSTIGTMVKVGSNHILQEGDIIHIGDRLEVSISMDTNNLGMPYKGYVWNTKENKVLDRHELRELIRQENKDNPEYANSELANAIDTESSIVEELIPSYCENIESNLLVKFEFGVNKDDVTPKSEYIDPKGVVLGRGPYAQSSYRKISVTNSNGYVSREHCLIYYDGSRPSGERWLLRDTSTLGTFLKIKPYSNPVPLPVGSIFKAGQCKIEVCSPDGPQYVQYPERGGALQNGNNQSPPGNNNNNNNHNNGNNNTNPGGNNNGTNGSGNNNHNGTDGGSNMGGGSGNVDQSGNNREHRALEDQNNYASTNDMTRRNVVEGGPNTHYTNIPVSYESIEVEIEDENKQTEGKVCESIKETKESESTGYHGDSKKMHNTTASLSDSNRTSLNSYLSSNRKSYQPNDAYKCEFGLNETSVGLYRKENTNKDTTTVENFVGTNWNNGIPINERTHYLDNKSQSYQQHPQKVVALHQMSSLQNEHSIEFRNRRRKQSNWFGGKKHPVKNADCTTRYRKGGIILTHIGNGKVCKNRKNGMKRNRLMMSGTTADHDTDYTISTSGSGSYSNWNSNQTDILHGEKSVGPKGGVGGNMMGRGNHQVLIKSGKGDEMDRILIAHKNGFKKQIIQRTKRNHSESFVMTNEMNEKEPIEANRNNNGGESHVEYGKMLMMNNRRKNNEHLKSLDSYQKCIIENDESYRNKEWLLT